MTVTGFYFLLLIFSLFRSSSKNQQKRQIKLREDQFQEPWL